MHALLASIFAALFSFCHASSVRQVSQTPVMFADEQPATFNQYVPSRQEIMHMQPQGSYAEGACSSCRVMNTSLDVR